MSDKFWEYWGFYGTIFVCSYFGFRLLGFLLKEWVEGVFAEMFRDRQVGHRLDCLEEKIKVLEHEKGGKK